MEGVMIRKVQGLLFLMCLMPVLMLGATDGKKYEGSVMMNPDTSAPDAWGYTWVRSTDLGGPTFNWIDITTQGTLVSGLGDDNYVGPLPIQFAFPYYWYTVSSFYIGSNGYINFSSPANFASPFFALPNTGATVPKDLLAILAGDLDFTTTGSNPRCYYWTNGLDSLVVSFINVSEWRTPNNPNKKHTFQVILNKADSSITYQYGVQQGRFDSAGVNYSLCMGWQNQTGQYGLSYYYGTTPPHAGLPDSGFAIKIKRTVNTGLSVTDAGIVGGFDAGNLGKIVRVGIPDTIKAVVKNFGTVALTNAPVRYAITRSGQPSAFDTVIVPSLVAGEQATVTFPRLFTAAVTGTYSALFNVTVTGDVGPGNNSKTAEIYSASFAVGQPTRIQFENGTLSGSSSWQGGGGFGVAMDLPPSVYPVRVESVFVQVGTINVQPMTVQILDGSTGVPGAVLATRTVTAVASSLNSIDFRSDSVRISSGRFFVGAIGDMYFYYESTAPIALRSWEYTNGWAPWRQADIYDVILRASVRPEATGVSVGVSLGSGWNMISNPVTSPVPDDSAKSLFPTIISRVFRFNNGYIAGDTMGNGIGYWGKFPGATTQPITGLPRTRDSITVAAGWNMVGSISNTVDTSTIVSVPLGLRASSWFGYSCGYAVVTQITPGKAFWVKANAAGKFVFANPLVAGSAKAEGRGNIEGLNRVTISDSKGGSQTLYFGEDLQKAIPLALYTMPPVPPLGAFDARFETADGGSMVHILITPAKRSNCVFSPKMCLPKRTTQAPLLLNFSSSFKSFSGEINLRNL